MRRVLWLSALLLTAVAPISAVRADSTGLVCNFKAGDLISADIFNELCSKIEPDLATTLIGTWSAQCWDANVSNVDSPGTGTLTITSLTNIGLSAANSASEHCMYGLITVTVSGLGFDRIKTVGNRAAVVTWHHSLESAKQLLWDISELQANSIIINLSATLIKLTRVNAVPTAPSGLSGSVSDKTVTLTWTDNSSDESSFSITRKDSLLGTYTQVGTVAANTATYSETVTAGTYWYRVQAVNTNGSSTGSNAVKVTVE